MIEEHLEAVGGGTATLIDPPGRITKVLADLERHATSWVMVTPGRIPPAALANMNRNEVARMAAGIGLLTSVEVTGDDMTLGISGLAHYLTDASGETSGEGTAAYLGGTARTLASYMSIMLPITPTYYAVRHGYTTPGVGAPTTVDIGDGAESVLDAVKWLANAFNASWRIVPDGTPANTNSLTDFRPRLDIRPLNDLWGSDVAPTVLVSPDLADSPPLPGTWVKLSTNPPVRVVRGSAKRTMDGSRLAGHTTVYNPQTRRMPEPVGVADGVLKVSTSSVDHNATELYRRKVYETSYDPPNPTPLDAIAATKLAADKLPIRSWEVTIDSPLGILSLPPGAPVALMDVRDGAADPNFLAMAGAHGVAPLVGLRVIGRKLPFVPRVMGCYVALAGIGKGWELIDVSEWVQEEQGTVEVAETLGRTNLSDINGGSASI